MKIGRRDGEYEKTEHEREQAESEKEMEKAKEDTVGTRSKLKMM